MVVGVKGGPCCAFTLTDMLVGVCGTPVVGTVETGGVAGLAIFSVFTLISGCSSLELPALGLAGVAERARSPSIGDFLGRPTLSLSTFGFAGAAFSIGNSGGNLSIRVL